MDGLDDGVEASRCRQHQACIGLLQYEVSPCDQHLPRSRNHPAHQNNSEKKSLRHTFPPKCDDIIRIGLNRIGCLHSLVVHACRWSFAWSDFTKNPRPFSSSSRVLQESSTTTINRNNAGEADIEGKRRLGRRVNASIPEIHMQICVSLCRWHLKYEWCCRCFPLNLPAYFTALASRSSFCSCKVTWAPYVLTCAILLCTFIWVVHGS